MAPPQLKRARPATPARDPATLRPVRASVWNTQAPTTSATKTSSPWMSEADTPVAWASPR